MDDYGQRAWNGYHVEPPSKKDKIRRRCVLSYTLSIQQGNCYKNDVVYYIGTVIAQKEKTVIVEYRMPFSKETQRIEKETKDVLFIDEGV
jgi:hypothetical protein